MKVERLPIASSPHVDDPRTWADVDVDVDGRISVARVNSDGVAHPVELSAHDARAANTERAGNLRIPDGAQEVMVTALCLDGTVETVPFSQQRPVYLAHLAFYDPAQDLLQVVQFIDDTPPADLGVTS